VVVDHETASKDPPVAPIGPRSAAEPPVAGSFEDVYRSSYARMVRTAHMLTGSSETAEEVVQDAFVRLYPRFDTVQDPAGYLYRSVVNGCWAGHRRRRVVERLRPLQSIVNDASPPEIDETWTALRRLPPRRRAVIVLRFYADLPIADIAQVLDCPTGTVKSLLHRSLAQLKDVLGQ
jgi:RNA polymerase sigma-70 factor (sigma-E family)